MSLLDIPNPPAASGRYALLPTATAWVDDEAAEAVLRIRTTVPPPQRPLDTILRLLILDLDGTLVRPVIGDRLGFPATPDDRRLIAGRLEVLRALRESGVLLAIATNQGGAAFGHGTPASIFPVVEGFAREIGAVAAIACWSHPKASVEPERLRVPEDPYRKPNAGMLVWLLKELLSVDEGYRPFTADAMYVGDRDEDRAAAFKIPNLTYEDAARFFPRVRALLGLPAEAPDPDEDPEGWLAAHARDAEGGSAAS